MTAAGAIRPSSPVMRWLLLTWPLALGLMHLTLGAAGGLYVTVGVLYATGAIAALLLVVRVSLGTWLLVTAAVAYALILGARATHFGEFVRSFLLIVNFLLFVVLAASAPAGQAGDSTAWMRVFLWVAVAIAVLTLLQAVMFNLMGDLRLASPLGRFTHPGPGGEIYRPGDMAFIKRPSAVFSEPSVAGWFNTLAAGIAWWLRPRIGRFATITALLGIAAGVSSLSLSGFLNATTLVAVIAIVDGSRGGRIMRFVLLATALLAIVGMLALFWQLGLSDRLETFAAEGSSAYYRTAAPLRLLAESLPEHPFGHPLGQTDYIAGKTYMINWEAGSTTNIDNTFFYVAYYFGIPGVVVGLLTLGRVVRMVLTRRRAALIAVPLVLALAESGSGLAHVGALLVGYALLAIRAADLTTPGEPAL